MHSVCVFVSHAVVGLLASDIIFLQLYNIIAIVNNLTLHKPIDLVCYFNNNNN